jgi:hypothetical protein
MVHVFVMAILIYPALSWILIKKSQLNLVIVGQRNGNAGGGLIVSGRMITELQCAAYCTLQHDYHSYRKHRDKNSFNGNGEHCAALFCTPITSLLDSWLQLIVKHTSFHNYLAAHRSTVCFLSKHLIAFRFGI